MQGEEHHCQEEHKFWGIPAKTKIPETPMLVLSSQMTNGKYTTQGFVSPSFNLNVHQQ
jgi:hypothetical protein